jgi:diguanylate cyclase
LLRELFINMTIIISFISIASQALKNYANYDQASARTKTVIGVVTGFLGIVLMIFAVHVGENTIIDFRNVIFALAAIHGGTISVVIYGIIIAVFRVAYFGTNLSSIFGVVLAILNVIGCGVIAKLKIRNTPKWVYSTLYVLSTTSIVFIILLKDKINIFYFLLIYWITTGIVAFIVAYYSDFCLTDNALFKKLQIESTKDFLTGLNNVRNFDSLFNSAIRIAKENGERLSLLMIDIDFFKKVNDTYGHAEGDIVLRELGKILPKNCRSFDKVSRNGGEEFTVLLFDCPMLSALHTAERIRSSVENHPFILSDGTKIAITVSIGVACYPEITDEAEKLLEIADVALYTAKRTGRNKVCSQNTWSSKDSMNVSS